MADSKLTPHEVRRVAVEAKVDPRTVAAFLAGKSQHHMMADHIRAVLRRLGHGALVPQPGDVAGVPTPEAVKP